MTLIKGKQVGSATLVNGNIVDNTIENAKIADATLQNNKIAANTITGNNLNDSAKQASLDFKLICARLRLQGLSLGTGTSLDITDAAFQAIKNSDAGVPGMGYDGNFVDREGLVTSAVNGDNKANLSDDNTDGEIVDGSNNTVFGRITETLTAKSGNNVTATPGSTTVTFSSPHNFVVGQYFSHTADTKKRVGKVASTTVAAIELEDNWEGDALAGVPGAQQVEITLDFLTKSGGSESAYTGQSETASAFVPVSITLLDTPAQAFVHSVVNTDGFPASHTHPEFTTTADLNATDSSGINESGADIIGFDDTGLTNISGSDLQTLGASIDSAISSAAGTSLEQSDDLTLSVGQTVAPGQSFPTNLSQTRLAGTALKLIINGLTYVDNISEAGGVVSLGASFPFTVDENDSVFAAYLR